MGLARGVGESDGDGEAVAVAVGVAFSSPPPQAVVENTTASKARAVRPIAVRMWREILVSPRG
jgi:hypothetical protein